MTKNQLIKVIKIQEIDVFFTKKGFSRKYIHNKIIEPNFFIGRKTYYNYLGINAKAKMTKLGLDWKEETERLQASNYKQLMEALKDKDPLALETYHQMLKDERKKI